MKYVMLALCMFSASAFADVEHDPAVIEAAIANGKEQATHYPKPVTPPWKAVFNRGDDAYFTDPWHPGRHWSCEGKQDGIEYENNEILVGCEGLVKYSVKRGKWYNKKRLTVVEQVPTIWCKGDFPNAAGESCDDVARRNFYAMFYDSRERALVWAKGGSLAFDLITTVHGLNMGCREGNPIARNLPGLSVGLAIWDVYDTRKMARQSPRYFTISRFDRNWAPVISHGIAGIHNLGLSCS